MVVLNWTPHSPRSTGFCAIWGCISSSSSFSSSSDAAANKRTIAKSGIVPFTRFLLEHPEVVAGSSARVLDREAATDAAAATAGDVNLGALNFTGLCRLSTEAKAKREGAARRCQGMEVPDGGMVLADLGEDGAVLVRRMGGVKAKGGAVFAAAQVTGDLEGIEFTAGSVRAVAKHIAKEQGKKAREAEADARLRADVADTDAGRTAAAAGRGGKEKGGGKGSRVSWKKAAADLSEKSAAVKEAPEAQVRALKVQLLAAQALAPRPPAAHPLATAPSAPPMAP